MTARRIVLALVVTLLPFSAFAQLDDLLSPLTPEKEEKAKPSKKKKARPSAKKAKEKAPEPEGDDDLLAPLVPVKGELLVKVSGPTEGAAITIDGQPAKVGQKVSLDAGEHTVVVKRAGYADFTRKVNVTANQVAEVNASMDAVAGVLTVTSDVAGASVVLDGKTVGEAPIRSALVSPGMHEIVVRREGFEDHVSRISVRAGKDYTVSGALKPKEKVSTIVASNADRPERTRLVPEADATEDGPAPLAGADQKVENQNWYERWYVWAGAGAVVVAAATTAVVAGSQANGRALTPSEVCDLDPNDDRPGACDDVINAPAALLRMGAGFGVRF